MDTLCHLHFFNFFEFILKGKSKIHWSCDSLVQCLIVWLGALKIDFYATRWSLLSNVSCVNIYSVFYGCFTVINVDLVGVFLATHLKTLIFKPFQRIFAYRDDIGDIFGKKYKKNVSDIKCPCHKIRIFATSGFPQKHFVLCSISNKSPRSISRRRAIAVKARQLNEDLFWKSWFSSWNQLILTALRKNDTLTQILH